MDEMVETRSTIGSATARWLMQTAGALSMLKQDWFTFAAYLVKRGTK